MRLEQLLYNENLCGWNNYYVYYEKLGIWMIGAVRQTCSDRGPRAVYSFFFISVRDFIVGISLFCFCFDSCFTSR